jgi:hypothetical protein
MTSIANTYYGWIRVEHFDEDGITFDFMTFKADQPEIQPINPSNLLAQSQGDQVTILASECYDLHHVGVIDCTESYALIVYHQVTKKNLTVMEIKGQGVPPVEFAVAGSSQPSKSDCTAALASSNSVIWPLNDNTYYCYVYVIGTHGYYGWLRPIHHDENGMTFDYLTWETTQ